MYHTGKNTYGVAQGSCFIQMCGQYEGASMPVGVRGLEIFWFGSAHFSPGIPVAQYEEQLTSYFGALPKGSHRVVFQGDLNTGFRWVEHQNDLEAIAKEGKGGLVHTAWQERGLRVCTPHRTQAQVPTSRPRQAGRQGQVMDLMATKCLRVYEWKVHVDSCFSF